MGRGLPVLRRGALRTWRISAQHSATNTDNADADMGNDSPNVFSMSQSTDTGNDHSAALWHQGL